MIDLREYAETHPEEWAADMERCAELMCEGDLEKLAAWVGRDSKERVKAAVGRLGSL